LQLLRWKRTQHHQRLPSRSRARQASETSS
jgi:hypothetical protein